MGEVKSYPRFQVSGFVGNDKRLQVVFRSEDEKEFEKDLEKAKELTGQTEEELRKDVDEVLGEVAENTSRVCNVCGAKANYREGVSKKTNKPWRAVFCTENEQHTKWL